MAETTYIFPTQTLLCGEVDVTIITSGGDGSTNNISEKYFSSLSIVDETEFEGGSLQSKFLDVSIEDDIDDLFNGTILPYLYESDGYIKVRVKINSKTKFYGIVEPSTLSSSIYVSDNDAGDNSRRTISFRCVWFISLLRRIKQDELIDQIISQRSALLTRLPYNGALTDEESIKIRGLAKCCMDELSANYSLTYNLVFDTVDRQFFTKTSMDGATKYVYPNAQSGKILSKFYLSPYDLELLFYNYNSGLNIGLFSDDNGLDNAYNYFVQILKSFGLIAILEDSDDYDVFVRITSRTAGDPVSVSDILSMNETIPSELSRNKISVSSTASGNIYEKEFDGNAGTSEYTDTVAYDFNNEAFDGSVDNENTQKSLMFPVKSLVGNSYWYVIRECGVGVNGLVNPRFIGDLSGWTVVSGSWVYSAINVFGYTGVAKLPLNGGGSTSGILRQTVTMDEGENYIFTCLLTSPILGGIPSTSTVTLKIFNSIGELVGRSSMSGNATNDTILKLSVAYKGKPNRSIGRESGTPNCVEIKIEDSSGFATPEITYYVGDTSWLRCRTGAPELLGKTVADYFDSRLITRKSFVANGISQNVKLRDYVTFDGERYYIKKIGYSVEDNETEYEAINYPY